MQIFQSDTIAYVFERRSESLDANLEKKIHLAAAFFH